MVADEKELEVLAYGFILHAQTFAQKLCCIASPWRDLV